MNNHVFTGGSIRLHLRLDTSHPELEKVNNYRNDLKFSDRHV